MSLISLVSPTLAWNGNAGSRFRGPSPTVQEHYPQCRKIPCLLRLLTTPANKTYLCFVFSAGSLLSYLVLPAKSCNRLAQSFLLLNSWISNGFLYCESALSQSLLSDEENSPVLA